jgi:hypothetical protein
MNHSRHVINAVAVICTVLLAFCALAGAAPDKKEKSVGRLLYGKVLDPQDSPVADAVVYVTNTRTRAVKTYIVSKDGTYRFPALATGVDYQVYAQFNNLKSDTKSVSQFDDRAEVYLDLKINTK